MWLLACFATRFRTIKPIAVRVTLATVIFSKLIFHEKWLLFKHFIKEIHICGPFQVGNFSDQFQKDFLIWKFSQLKQRHFPNRRSPSNSWSMEPCFIKLTLRISFGVFVGHCLQDVSKVLGQKLDWSRVEPFTYLYPMYLENDFIMTKRIWVEKKTHFEGVKIGGRIFYEQALFNKGSQDDSGRHDMRQLTKNAFT